MSGEEDRAVSTYETYVSTPSERTVLLVKKREDTWRDAIGLYEPVNGNFWRYTFAEFIYSLLFTMIACGCSLNLGTPRSDLHQALCVGAVVAVLVSMSAQKFGYFNPAISFGLLVARKITLVRFLVYAAFQVAGSCAGAGLLYLYTPSKLRGHLGTLSIHEDVDVGVGFVIELTLTFVVMLVVMATAESANFVVGLAVTVAMLMGMPYTGAGVNPIRAFGPAAITGNLVTDHWIYWVGPIVGALCAALTYEFIIKLSPEPLRVEEKHLPTVQLNIKSSSSTAAANSNV